MEWLDNISIIWLIILIIVGFIAGYIDAIAGGGGMIQVLALLMAGLPPINILATNKLVSIAGTSMAVTKYALGKKINWTIALACILPCLLASALGSKLVMYLSDSVITGLIILCIPIAFLFMFGKQQSFKQTDEVKNAKKAVLYLTPIGFYDGLLGPGTGTYMAITANRALKMNFLRATALAKPLNLSTNIGAGLVYIFAGKVLWLIAIPMAIASLLGAYIGSHSAIKKGDQFIRKVMMVMLVVMLLINLIKYFL